MRTFTRNRRLSLFLASVIALSASACHQSTNSGSTTVGINDTPALPPTFTEQQCTDVLASFPGWAQVAPVPANDSQGRPTLWYAVIPITASSQLDDLATVGIDVEPQPIFTDAATEQSLSGQTGVMSKSTCGGAEIHWAIVPGPVFNAIKTATAQTGQTLVSAIVLQPVPDVFADTTITYQQLHPISYQALSDAGFAYMGVNAPNPNDSSPDGATQVAFLGLPSLGSIVKAVVRAVAGATQGVVNGVERGIGWIDRELQGSVKLTVHLDVRNSDPNFGGSIGQPAGGSTDASTRMLRAWGAQAGAQMPLPGVTVAAQQVTLSIDGYGIRTRFQGTADANGTASFSITKGKSTGICLDLENGAATLNDYITRMEICGFEKDQTAGNGSVDTDISYDADTAVNVELQNKYTNVMAQLSDGNSYLNEVAGYAPHKLSALAGPLANEIGKFSNGRAITPCLDFPNVPLDILDGTLLAAATLVPVVGDAVAAALAVAEVALEVDMWLPDDGVNLQSRAVASHEYGHFAMCSLLYDEDDTKMVQIPSLILQRIAEGTYGDATDQVAYIMEGWADFFAGQTANGANYFTMENDIETGSINFCAGSSDACWDWNYVDDLNNTPAGASGSVGFNHQVRRIATTLFDAFDGHPRGGNDPGEGDFWGFSNSTTFLVQSAEHDGDARDEIVALPGSGLRELIHNWTHAASPLGWQVNEEQFFGALTATIRATADPSRSSGTYGWCDVCKMFAQHDGLSCTLTGNTSYGGECTTASSAPVQPAISIGQMVDVCLQSPNIASFIGAAPAATDPTSPCTFAGCPSHAILVGSVGDATATCAACGPHQVSTGASACPVTVCPSASVSATTCVDCADDQIVGGANGNSCVSCPPLQIPSADRTTCVQCAPHQISSGTSCLDCADSQIAAPDNSCQACPAGQIPYSNTGVVGPAPTFGESCIDTSDCSCTAGYCRTINSAGVCVDTIG